MNAHNKNKVYVSTNTAAETALYKIIMRKVMYQSCHLIGTEGPSSKDSNIVGAIQK